MSESLYLGLISGTSMDGIDVALAAFSGERFCGLRATRGAHYPPDLRKRLLRLGNATDPVPLQELCTLDAGVADCFADAANALLAEQGLDRGAITAIGSHGQTVFHEAGGDLRLTLQIGDPNRIAARTGITTVADFRRRDLALGGQGAPLVPAFHHAVFAVAGEPRCVVNLGGIGNITALPDADSARVRGFDTGPANGLMDEWSQRHLGRPYDADGALAARGHPVAALLTALLGDPYFRLPAPKSTGRAYFNLAWAQRLYPALENLDPADVQATFAELSARTVASDILLQAPTPRRVLLCGGGARNTTLVNRIRHLLPQMMVETTDSFGLNAEWVEAAAFAWLAMRRLHGLPGNLPGVTGASAPAVLGGLYPA